MSTSWPWQIGQVAGLLGLFVLCDAPRYCANLSHTRSGCLWFLAVQSTLWLLTAMSWRAGHRGHLRHHNQ